MKKITKFKYENIVFIALVTVYVMGAIGRTCSITNNLLTLAMQLFMSLGVKTSLRYVRRNAIEIKNQLAIC